VYNQHYQAVLDGMETDSIMEIDPTHRIEIFRMGNGSNEVLEVHDFKHVSIDKIHITHSILYAYFIYRLFFIIVIVFVQND
jgi:hypothetical protein